MARPLRVDIADGIYHVMSRGIDRKLIYKDDKDRFRFLDILQGAQERFRLRIYAYVLMDNHFHLIVCTPDANLSKAIQWIKVSYSMWFNAKYKRVGPLFQGRFRSELVDVSGSWLIDLSLYVHLNPVRVSALGLNKRKKALEANGWVAPGPEEAKRRLDVLRNYRWSSYPYYVGFRRAVPEWLDIRVVLNRVAHEAPEAVYLALAERRIAQGHEEKFLNQLKNRLALGSSEFIERVKQLCSPVDRDIAGQRELRKRCSWEDVVSATEKVCMKDWNALQERGEWGRFLAYRAARKYAGMTLKEIAEKCGFKDYGAVSMGLRRFIVRSEKDSIIRAAMTELDKMLNVQT